MTKRSFLALMGVLAFAGAVLSQDGPLPEAPHPRGYKPLPPEVKAEMHADAHRRHGQGIKDLPAATQPKFDCRDAFKNVLPANDQGSCGDCFGVSAADGCSMALIRAKKLPLNDSKGRLSSQYGLDNPNAFRGGCNGGSEVQVIDFIKKNGFPLESDYGDYTARRQRLKPLDGMTTYQIEDWGYCTPSQEQGQAKTQDIKNCMARYGPISVAFDAGGCDGYRWPAVIAGRGGNVDHAVLCIGWDDEKGAFLGMNQWKNWGGPNCTFWIKYGAYSWGTEAVWMTAGDPPEPVPPAPPIPPPSPCPHMLGVHVGAWTFVVGAGVGGVAVFLITRRKPPVTP